MLIFENPEDQERFINLVASKVVEIILEKGLSSKPNFDQGEDILSPGEAKKLLQQSIPSINKLVKNGILRKYKFPESRRVYFFKSQIIKALKENMI